MEDLIADYEKTRMRILQRILFLKKKLRETAFMTIERQRLEARITELRKENYELLDAINDMRRRY